MSSHTLPRPEPWRNLRYRNSDLARLFGAAYAKRRLLAAWYPWVPAPPARVGSPYCRSNSCYPAGALVLLWKWEYLRGPCPDCGSDGLGFAFAGGLSNGYVTGVCSRCATMLTRFIWGINTIMSGIKPILEGSPFSVTGLLTPTTDWAPVALVAALGELGARDLPDPQAPSMVVEYRVPERGAR